MKLKAVCQVTVAVHADCPVVTMLRPRSGVAQQMISSNFSLSPAVPIAHYVDLFGNLCQRLVVPQGEMLMSTEICMQVEDQIVVAPKASSTPVHALPDGVLQYLLQSRYCPSDKMAEHANNISRNAAPGYAQAESIRAWINENLEYRYGVSSISTDAMDSLGHGAGVCRDFAHVGIALCRSLTLPARIVVGFLHGLEPMDLHAWFEVFLDGRWYTFDATQREPKGGRIVLAYGRDAADVAFISDYGSSPLEVTKMRVDVQALAAGLSTS